MAITQTRSVAGSSAGAYPSTPHTISVAARPRLIFPMLEKNLDYMDTPVTKMIKKGATVDNPKVEFTGESYSALTATVDSNGFDNAVTTINMAAGHGQRLTLWSLWDTPNGERLLVTGISTDAATVATRGSIGGTSAATIAANAVLKYAGQAVPEHVDAPQGILTRGEETYNHIQQFELGITIPWLEDYSDNSYLVRGSSVYVAELKKQAKELQRAFEITLIKGKRTIATTAGIPYTMGGIDYFTTANATALAGALLTEAAFLSAATTVLNDVGPGGIATTVLLNIFAKQVINSWVDPMRRATANERKFSSVIDEWETEVGRFSFLYSYHMYTDRIIGVNFPDLSRHAYKNLDWQDGELARNGMVNVGHAYGVHTALFPGNRQRWKISGFSETRGDYPLLSAA